MSSVNVHTSFASSPWNDLLTPSGQSLNPNASREVRLQDRPNLRQSITLVRNSVHSSDEGRVWLAHARVCSASSHNQHHTEVNWCLRDSAVGIPTSYGLDKRGVGVRVPVGSKNFLFSSTSSRPVLGPIQHPIQWVPGALTPGVKRQRREADNSPPATAEVKKICIYTSTSRTPSWSSA
jgi:hypothetical protein